MGGVSCLFTLSLSYVGCTLSLMPMTHAPETGARKLASVSGAGFLRQLQNFWRQKPTRTNKK